MPAKKSVNSLPLFVDFYEINNPKSRLAKFNELIDQSREVYIVSAWVTRIDDVLERFVKEPSKTLNLILGLDKYITDPSIFDFAQRYKNINVWVPKKSKEPKEGIFHPKMYIFSLKNGKTKALVGSMNFTNSGLGRNSELLIEFDNAEKLIEEFKKLCDGSCEEPKKERINKYRSQYLEIEKSRKELDSKINQAKKESRKYLNYIYPETWEDYVKSLKECSQQIENNETFTLGDDDDQWTKTIEDAANIFSEEEKKKKWTKYKTILYGTGGCYRLFGGAPVGGKNFINDANHRKKVLSILKSFRDENFSEKTPEEKLEIVLHYYDRLLVEGKGKGIGPAIASRFLALVRPDVAVSYNEKSKEYFCNLRELGKGVKGDREGYKQALMFVYNQVWYNSPEPKNQKSIWQNRAALIDIIAYATCPSDKHQKSKSNVSSITPGNSPRLAKA